MSIREYTEGVTFANFAELMRRRGDTPQLLATRFRDQFGARTDQPGYESPRSYFDRIANHDPSPETLIPYRMLVDFYVKATRPQLRGDQKDRFRRCLCGCGSALLFARRQYASETCEKRGERGSKFKGKFVVAVPSRATMPSDAPETENHEENP